MDPAGEATGGESGAQPFDARGVVVDGRDERVGEEAGEVEGLSANAAAQVEDRRCRGQLAAGGERAEIFDDGLEAEGGSVCRWSASEGLVY